MAFEIIDFHTHPFSDEKNNICSHKEFIPMDEAFSMDVLKGLGISKICGSVVSRDNDKYETLFDKIKENNDEALKLKEYYKGFYVPGFHIHPDFPEESISEIKRMNKEGVKLIGEIIPYMDGWKDYGDDKLYEILNEAGKHNMVISFHTIPENIMGIEKMVKEHPDLVFVAAHPGEYPTLMLHFDLAKKYDNYYLDLSGTGITRYGMLKRAIDVFSADRILFGTDYPTCNPAMFVGGVVNDMLIKDSDKEKILSLNAKKLLSLNSY